MENSEMKPPLQPIDIKKAGLPPKFILFLVVFGFGIAAAAFAFFSRAILKKKPVDEPKKASAEVKTIVEVAPVSTSAPQAETVSRSAKPLPVLNLSGIVYGAEGSYALINGRIVSEGGKVEGAVLEKVSPDRVELSFDGRKITLKSR